MSISQFDDLVNQELRHVLLASVTWAGHEQWKLATAGQLNQRSREPEKGPCLVREGQRVPGRPQEDRDATGQEGLGQALTGLAVARQDEAEDAAGHRL